MGATVSILVNGLPTIRLASRQATLAKNYPLHSETEEARKEPATKLDHCITALERLMPRFEIASGLRMIGHTADSAMPSSRATRPILGIWRPRHRRLSSCGLFTTCAEAQPDAATAKSSVAVTSSALSAELPGEDGREIKPAPASHPQAGQVGLPKLNSSPRKPLITARIFSSAENCSRVARRISIDVNLVDRGGVVFPQRLGPT